MGEELDRSLAVFEREFDDFTDRLVPAEVVRIQSITALQALNGVVKRTPVDTGATRANWQLTLGTPATGERVSGDPVGDGALVLTGLQPFDVAWIVNNREHVSVLEEGGFVPADPGPSKDPRKGRKGRILVAGGYSVQAPVGMVAVTIEEITQQLGS